MELHQQVKVWRYTLSTSYPQDMNLHFPPVHPDADTIATQPPGIPMKQESPMTDQPTPELQAYERNLPMWLAAHEGEFVVLKGDTMVHFAQSYEDALTWAYESFGLTGFFVKRVAADAAVVHLSRDIGLCR